MNNILEPNTLEVVIAAYNEGILAYGAMTLRGGWVSVSLEIKSRFNVLSVSIGGEVAGTLTLWNNDDDHASIIRECFGGYNA